MRYLCSAADTLFACFTHIPDVVKNGVFMYCCRHAFRLFYAYPWCSEKWGIYVLLQTRFSPVYAYPGCSEKWGIYVVLQTRFSPVLRLFLMWWKIRYLCTAADTVFACFTPVPDVVKNEVFMHYCRHAFRLFYAYPGSSRLISVANDNSNFFWKKPIAGVFSLIIGLL